MQLAHASWVPTLPCKPTPYPETASEPGMHGPRLWGAFSMTSNRNCAFPSLNFFKNHPSEEGSRHFTRLPMSEWHVSPQREGYLVPLRHSLRPGRWYPAPLLLGSQGCPQRPGRHMALWGGQGIDSLPPLMEGQAVPHTLWGFEATEEPEIHPK